MPSSLKYAVSVPDASFDLPKIISRKAKVVRKLVLGIKAKLAAHPDRYALSVSATTRDPRPGEKDGVDYFFVTDETFDSMIQKDDFLEYAKYVSHSYGTPRSYVEENLNLGKNVILEIEIQGALKVKEKIKDAVLMFVTAPDAGTLRDRLVGRGVLGIYQIFVTSE